jgi:Holliday junction resolvase
MSRLDRERSVRRALERAGWTAVRATKGPVDVVACRPVTIEAHNGRPELVLSEVRFIQVKSTRQSPYERFGPADRKILLELANQAGASAYLMWWPPNRGWQWIAANEWPKPR